MIWYDAFVQMVGGFGLINTNEDCLHLSLHVPLHQEGDGPLAVMVWTTIIIIKIIIKIIDNNNNHSTIIITTIQVWLTGGAFIMGGGSWFGPDYWMIHNIILVNHHTGHHTGQLSYWSYWSYDIILVNLQLMIMMVWSCKLDVPET